MKRTWACMIALMFCIIAASCSRNGTVTKAPGGTVGENKPGKAAGIEKPESQGGEPSGSASEQDAELVRFGEKLCDALRSGKHSTSKDLRHPKYKTKTERQLEKDGYAVDNSMKIQAMKADSCEITKYEKVACTESMVEPFVIEKIKVSECAMLEVKTKSLGMNYTDKAAAAKVDGQWFELLEYDTGGEPRAVENSATGKIGVPAYPGAKEKDTNVNISASPGSGFEKVALTTNDSFEKVRDFYKKFFDENIGGKGNFIDTDPTSSQAVWELDGYRYALSISYTEEENHVFISIMKVKIE